MGSEHYCLRWNNHQSNLLGVFSQLLESESLVDVTLACTEGPSIRAHKVVLSACSSYFQALFLDHPNRHPIVILKDVRFAELRTLVDFMYKGEVNVEYCQLSALLKTAESLKVKGLADMTNINAAAVQASRDEQQQQQQQSSHEERESTSPAATINATTASTLSSTGTTTTTTTTTPALTSNSVPAPAEPMLHDGQDERYRSTESSGHHAKDNNIGSRDSRNNDKDRDCRDRDRDRERDREKREERDIKRESSSREKELQPMQLQQHSQHSQQNSENEDCSADDVEIAECPPSPQTRPRLGSGSPCPGPLALDRPRSRRDSDSAASLEETRAGSLSPLSVHSGPSDMSLSNNTGGGGPGLTPVSIPLGGLPQSRLPSPHSTEPLAGPSGLPPVQQVPLSLKKEVDWERSTEERSASSEMSSSDYRLPPDPELMGMDERVFACMYCGASFLHQSKLTRHILSHSLESLKYREQAAHFQLQAAQLGLEPGAAAGLHLGPELAGPGAGHYPPGSGLGPAGGLGPIEPMDLELAAVHSDPSSGVVLCKFCGKSFPDVGSLISHLPAHTGDRPFKCEFCGKAFKLRHHMKDHCRVHTGERPFRCSLCGKTFSRSTILKAHEKTHYPKYVRKFLSPSPVDPSEEAAAAAAVVAPPDPPNPHSHH